MSKDKSYLELKIENKILRDALEYQLQYWEHKRSPELTMENPNPPLHPMGQKIKLLLDTLKGYSNENVSSQ